jgi:hypothetical protein
MTGPDLCVNSVNQSRSYLNHLVVFRHLPRRNEKYHEHFNMTASLSDKIRTRNLPDTMLSATCYTATFCETDCTVQVKPLSKNTVHVTEGQWTDPCGPKGVPIYRNKKRKNYISFSTLLPLSSPTSHINLTVK